MARARNNAEVAHAFAHKERSIESNKFFYERHQTPFGGIIYSFDYHFPIAAWIEKNLILFTTRKWPGTYTARHISLTRTACNHIPTIEVYDVEDFDWYKKKPRRSVVIENLKAMFDEAVKLSGKQKSARKYSYLEDIARLQANAKAYYDLRKVKKGLTKEVKDFVSAEEFDAEAFVGIGAEIAQKIKDRAKREEAARRKKRKDYAVKCRKEFYEHKTYAVAGSVGSTIREFFGDLITRKDDEVITSQGVRIPIKDAELTYKAIERSGWEPKRYQAQLGGYNEFIVTNNGFELGCHSIKKETIVEFARQQGWAQ